VVDLRKAVELCVLFEGFRSKPYKCPASIPTIGYGSTFYLDNTKVTLDDIPVTEQQAKTLLIDTIEKEYLPGTLRLCPILAEHNNKLNAIVDFTYNLGVGRLQTSTLRRKINEGDWEAAKQQLSLWTRGGGVVLKGLVLRRAAEIQLFD